MPADSVGTTHSNPAYSPAAQGDIESGSGPESKSCIGKGGWVTQCFKWPLRHPYLALGALVVTAGTASYGIYELTRAGAGVVGTVGTLLANRTITANPPPPAKPAADRSTTVSPTTFDICRNPACKVVWEPVCASDGKTYPNICVFNYIDKCSGIYIKVKSEGECP
ncbi:Kazal-type serine protease inhibitor family protein [Endozoicomonas sp.]|uniref:Kazal-type serine protease inhibitor family protein n=1 Tax=Endozoicomonas sp. TaxID=1892382 RepID=UPI00383B8FB9